jgi:ATP-dependent DNA helicase RecG
LTMHTSLSDQARFKQSYSYPQIACREALINAIVHRNYAIQGRGIEISIFSDRLEIASPGRVLSTISLDDIRKLHGAHESRNPLVARVLREVGYVREMGEGIRRIYDVMRSNALAEPDIQSNDDNFTVTLFHRSLYDPRVKLWLSLFEEFKLSENQTAVLALGFEGKEFSTQDIIDRLGIVDTDQVREILTPLRQLRLVVRTKNDTKAIAISKARKIPKRSVPMFKVTANPADKSRIIDAAPISDELEAPSLPVAEARLYFSNISYDSTVESICAALEEEYNVLSVDLPPSTTMPGRNRGFAFVTLEVIDGTEAELVAALQGIDINGRKMNVRRKRR